MCSSDLGQHELPYPSFVSTSLMLPFALGWSKDTCCLLKIHVRFDQVPGLAVMDHLTKIHNVQNQFEVVLHPCFLQVQNIQTVRLSKLLTPAEQKIMPAFARFPPPSTVQLVTCRALPGRLVFDNRSVRLLPRGKRVSRHVRVEEKKVSPATNLPELLQGPDQDLVLTLRWPNGQTAAYPLLLLLLQETFPQVDAHGKEVFARGTFVDIPEAFRIDLVHRFEPTISVLMQHMKDSLRVHNRGYAKLKSRHATYCRNMQAKKLGPLVRYVRGDFMDGQFSNNSFEVGLEDGNKVALSNVQASAWDAWKKKGLFFYDRKQEGMRVFRELILAIKRAPVVPGEFVLWRKEVRPLLKAARPGQRLPYPSFVSTSLMLPFVMSWEDHAACCLLKIHVRFDQVPGLSVMDEMSRFHSVRNQFEVVLHPCFLEVQDCQTVHTADLLTPEEKKILPVFMYEIRLPPPQPSRSLRAEPNQAGWCTKTARSRW